MTVYLVGAGPGDPGLLTARALELIAAADVVIYDRLIPESALGAARPGAELLYAGKEGGGPSMPQTEIERLLIEHGAAGKLVVRLKGGDPFVFGRGGEEAEALHQAKVPFEVVPGVTAGVAAPAYAGIPVTHRDAASAVAFITGHEDPAKPGSALDWQALAAFPGTLVVYMGVRQLSAISDRLIAAGRDPGATGGRDRARHASGPAHRGRDACDARERGSFGWYTRASDRAIRTGRRAARAPSLGRAPSLVRRDGRGHPRAGPGKRAGGAPA